MWLATKVIDVLPESLSKAKTVLNVVPILSNWELFQRLLLNHTKAEGLDEQPEKSDVAYTKCQIENTENSEVAEAQLQNENGESSVNENTKSEIAGNNNDIENSDAMETPLQSENSEIGEHEIEEQ